MIADFNRTNPHAIRVRGEFAGSYGDIYNKMVVGLQGGVVADLVVAYQNQAREYLQADGIVDLTPYMTSPRWGLSREAAADYVQAFLRQDHIGGRQIALPPNRSIEVLYHNNDWLRELGAAWASGHVGGVRPPVPGGAGPALQRQMREGRAASGSSSTRMRRRLASMTFSRGGDFLDGEGARPTRSTPRRRPPP